MFSSTTKESASDTVNDAKSTAYGIKRDLRVAADDAKQDLTAIASNAGRHAREFVDAANDRIHYAGDKVAEEVRSNPVRSSLIALGAGFILGALFRR